MPWLWNRLPKNSGMVAEERCLLMTLVRRPRMTQASRLPIRAFSTHTFRKTFGRYVYELMGRSAEGLILLNQIFRHSNLETTRRYIGLAQEDIDKVFDSIRL